MDFADKDGATEVYIPVHPWAPFEMLFERGFRQINHKTRSMALI